MIGYDTVCNNSKPKLKREIQIENLKDIDDINN